MKRSGITNATTRRLVRPAVRIAVPVLALLLAVTAIAVPAQAATPVTSPAGATWSQLMRRKLDLATESTRLSALLPGLRAAATMRSVNLFHARQALTTATKTLIAATAADKTAHLTYVKARAAAATAKTALTTAQRLKPANPGRVATAKKALAAAYATSQAKAAAAAKTAAAVKAATTTQTKATTLVANSATVYTTATNTITSTEKKIASLPPIATALGVQATAISGLVVTQTRATFTIAQTTKVYGITVNKFVAFPFQRMIDDAARVGIQLSGGGFRTRQQQIALRTINGCPNVWTAPSSSCRVPTAIPGRSLHELGLAVDMTTAGRTVSRKTPAFVWLTAHAGKYGFVNLPSESWHWSITGS